MKHWMLAAVLVCFGSIARAQLQSLPTISGTAAAPLPLSAPAANALQLAQAASVSKMPAGPWAGRLDLKSPPSLAAYQSFTSLSQAFGIQKNIWSLYKGQYEVARLGVFGGYYKPLLSAVAPRSLGGATLLVPGSVLDWAMGTNYGAQWLPSLKTGILVGYDLTRPKYLSLRPDFAGPGVTYAWGATSAPAP